MRNRKIFFSILGGIFALAIILSVIIMHSREEVLRVIFLDVGQGDAILISQGSQQVLIDGGKDGKLLLEKLGKYIPFWDRKIENIIETHPDQDHIGGLISVLQTYEVESVLETKMQSESQTFKKLEETIAKNKVEKVEAKKNVLLKFSNGATLQILYPFDSVTDVNGMHSPMSYLTL